MEKPQKEVACLAAVALILALTIGLIIVGILDLRRRMKDVRDGITADMHSTSREIDATLDSVRDLTRRTEELARHLAEQRRARARKENDSELYPQMRR